MMDKLCKIEGCGRKQKSLGLCSGHYKRNRRYGTPDGGGTIKGSTNQWIERHKTFSRDECLVWPFYKRGGYAVINRYDGNHHRPMMVSRLMCEHRHGPAPSVHHEAAHNCGNGHLGCVNPMHLEWKSHAENMADTIIHGTSTRGNKNSQAKLTATQVIFIRESNSPNKDLSIKFGIHPTTVSHIKARRIWQWL